MRPLCSPRSARWSGRARVTRRHVTAPEAEALRSRAGNPQSEAGGAPEVAVVASLRRWVEGAPARARAHSPRPALGRAPRHSGGRGASGLPRSGGALRTPARPSPLAPPSRPFCASLASSGWPRRDGTAPPPLGLAEAAPFPELRRSWGSGLIPRWSPRSRAAHGKPLSGEGPRHQAGLFAGLGREPVASGMLCGRPSLELRRCPPPLAGPDDQMASEGLAGEKSPLTVKGGSRFTFSLPF